MDVIALQGKANIGKTSTLSMLNNLLERNSNEFKKIYDDKLNSSGDFQSFYSIKSNGKKILIHSEGDSKNSVSEALSKAKEIKADILVVPCRSRGGTVDVIKAEKDTGSLEKLLFFQKAFLDGYGNYPETCNQVNKIESEALYKLISAY